MLSGDEIAIIPKLIAGFAFLLGIAAALLIAVFAQRASQKTMPKTQNLLGYWLAVAIDGERDEKMEEELLADVHVGASLGKLSRSFGWVSAILFFVGSLSIGWGMIEGHVPDPSSVSVTFQVQK